MKYDFSNLINSHLKDFCGRKFVFEEYNNFIKENDSGYFIVEGELGIGKSALISKYISENNSLYHFNSSIQGINKYNDFLTNIADQVKYRLNITLPDLTRDSYVNPFSISILRSFTINLYQLYLNAHKGEKIMKAKVNMAEIKRTCHHLDDFASEIFELEA